MRPEAAVARHLPSARYELTRLLQARSSAAVTAQGAAAGALIGAHAAVAGASAVGAIRVPPMLVLQQTICLLCNSHETSLCRCTKLKPTRLFHLLVAKTIDADECKFSSTCSCSAWCWGLQWCALLLCGHCPGFDMLCCSDASVMCTGTPGERQVQRVVQGTARGIIQGVSFVASSGANMTDGPQTTANDPAPIPAGGCSSQCCTMIHRT